MPALSSHDGNCFLSSNVWSIQEILRYSKYISFILGSRSFLSKSHGNRWKYGTFNFSDSSVRRRKWRSHKSRIATLLTLSVDRWKAVVPFGISSLSGCVVSRFVYHFYSITLPRTCTGHSSLRNATVRCTPIPTPTASTKQTLTSLMMLTELTPME